MKNTKKLLVGVLSVAALLGTGVAAWTIGGGLTSHSETLDPTVVNEIGTRDIALNVTKDEADTIVFDSTPDLDITYNVKAKAAEGAAVGFEPYDLANYEKVAEEYQPDLTVTTKAYDVTNPDERVELKSDDPFYQYVKLPEVQTIDYKIWLASEEKGYDVELTFAWSDKYGNPQEYVDSELAAKSADEQRAFIKNMIAALENVQFEFVFEVKGVKEDLPPVEEETGTVTLPTVEGSTLSIEGYDPEKGTVTAGRHLITITTDEGKVVENNKLTIYEGETPVIVTLNESPLTRATGHTYNYEHEFKAGVAYSFDYKVVDETPDPATKYAVTFSATEGGSIDVKVDGTSITSGEEVDEGKEVVVTVTANEAEGYKLTKLTVNDQEQALENTTLTLTVDKALNIKATFEKEDTPVVEYTKLDDVLKLENGTVFTTRGYYMGKSSLLNEEYNTYNSVFIGDGATHYQLFRVSIDLIDGLDLIPEQTIIEVTGTVSNYEGSVTTPEANITGIKVIEEDAEVAKPIIQTINAEQPQYVLDESKINQKVRFEEATVTSVSVGNYGNTTISLQVGDYDYSIYLDTRYNDLTPIEGLVKGMKLTANTWVGATNDGFRFNYIEDVSFVEVQPESVTLNAEKTEIYVNEKIELSYTTVPEVVSVKPTFTSSEETVATVDENGVVTGVGEGKTTITVDFENRVKNTIEITILPGGDIPVTGEYTYTWEINSGEYDSDQTTLTIAMGDLFVATWDIGDANSNNNPKNTYDPARIYAGQTFKISSDTALINTISYIDKNGEKGNIEIIDGDATVSKDSITNEWTITSNVENGISSVTFKAVAQTRFKDIVINYTVK